MRQLPSLARLLGSAALTAMLAAGLGGCQTMADITGSLTSKAETSPSPDNDPRRAAEFYGERHRAHPQDPQAALAYCHALPATGQRGPAGAVLAPATPPHPRKEALPPGLGPRARQKRNFQACFCFPPPPPSPQKAGWVFFLGAGTRAQTTGRAGGPPPLLRQRLEDRARRAV